MIKFGTLTFAAECLTDSDSEAEVVPSEVASASKKNNQSASEDMFLIRRSSASACSEDLPKKHLKTLDRKF